MQQWIRGDAADDVKLVELNAKMLALHAHESAAYAEIDRSVEAGSEEAGLNAEDRRDSIVEEMCGVYDEMLKLTPTSLDGCRALALGIIYNCHGGAIIRDGINGEGPEGAGLCRLLQALTGLPTRLEVLTPDEPAA